MHVCGQCEYLIFLTTKGWGILGRAKNVQEGQKPEADNIKSSKCQEVLCIRCENVNFGTCLFLLSTSL